MVCHTVLRNLYSSEIFVNLNQFDLGLTLSGLDPAMYKIVMLFETKWLAFLLDCRLGASGHRR